MTTVVNYLQRLRNYMDILLWVWLVHGNAHGYRPNQVYHTCIILVLLPWLLRRNFDNFPSWTGQGHLIQSRFGIHYDDYFWLVVPLFIEINGIQIIYPIINKLGWKKGLSSKSHLTKVWSLSKSFAQNLIIGEPILCSSLQLIKSSNSVTLKT